MEAFALPKCPLFRLFGYKLKKRIELFSPIFHGHRNILRGSILGVIEIHCYESAGDFLGLIHEAAKKVPRAGARGIRMDKPCGIQTRSNSWYLSEFIPAHAKAKTLWRR